MKTGYTTLLTPKDLFFLTDLSEVGALKFLPSNFRVNWRTLHVDSLEGRLIFWQPVTYRWSIGSHPATASTRK